MRFTDDETDRAIRIIKGVQDGFGLPLQPPEEVLEYKRLAEAGDEEAYVAWMTAALRMIFPDEPSDPPRSQTASLWKSIMDGRLEGIRIAEHLNYQLAWEETNGGTCRAPLGSYFDSFCNTAVRNELTRATL